MQAGSNPLVSTAWLAEHQNDSSIRIIEVYYHQGDAAYDKGHIPGAVGWYWKDALWDDSDREFATPEQMATRLGRIGVTPESTIVLYGDPSQFGTYAFWVLTMCGHPDIRILDGGRLKWEAEGRPMTTDVPLFVAGSYAVQQGDQTSRVGRKNVVSHLDDADRVLLDVRSIEEYRGERVNPPGGFDHGAERRGRIPGAQHVYFREFLNDDDTYKSAEELRRMLAGHGIEVGGGKEIVGYCRLSHRATTAWIALKYLLGDESAKIYDGSWTEWGSIVGFPIER